MYSLNLSQTGNDVAAAITDIARPQWLQKIGVIWTLFDVWHQDRQFFGVQEQVYKPVDPEAPPQKSLFVEGVDTSHQVGWCILLNGPGSQQSYLVWELPASRWRLRWLNCKIEKAVEAQLVSQMLDGSNAISVLTFLPPSQMVSDTNWFHRGLRMGLFHFVMKKTAEAPQRTHMPVKGKSSTSRSWTGIVLSTLNSPPRNTRTRRYHWQSLHWQNELQTAWRSEQSWICRAHWDKSPTSRAAYDKYQLKGAFFNGLKQAIWLTVGSFCVKKMSVLLQQQAHHAPHSQKCRKGHTITWTIETWTEERAHMKCLQNDNSRVCLKWKVLGRLRQLWDTHAATATGHFRAIDDYIQLFTFRNDVYNRFGSGKQPSATQKHSCTSTTTTSTTNLPIAQTTYCVRRHRTCNWCVSLPRGRPKNQQTPSTGQCNSCPSRSAGYSIWSGPRWDL